MPAGPNITALIGYGGSIFATLTNAVYNAGAGTLGWSGILASNLTVPAGQAFTLLVTNNQPGVELQSAVRQHHRSRRRSACPPPR